MVYSKWLRSLRYGNDYFKLMEPTSYFTSYHKFIDKLLNSPTGYVKLAVLSDDNDVVLGFLVGRINIVDYIHVQRDYRRIGIASTLVSGNVLSITHLTQQGMSFWNNRLPKAIFNPFV